MILKRKFYNRKTLEVAKDLLGCVLVRKSASWRRQKEIRAVITDVEAYVGEDDLANHASKGRTSRTEIMYGEAGRAYVYLVYGMYNVLNVITEKKDFPAAVMIRGIKIADVDYKKTNGPGKLCKVLQIDRNLNGHDVTKGEGLWIEKCRSRVTAETVTQKFSEKNIVANKRIGVDYAKHCKEYLWRFTLADFAGKKK